MKTLTWIGHCGNAAGAAAALLRERTENQGSHMPADLSKILFVLPGRNAIRSVTAELAAGKCVFPPLFQTPGGMLYFGVPSPEKRPASDTESAVLWLKVLKNMDQQDFRIVFPDGLDTTDPILLKQVAEKLISLRKELSGNLHSISSAAQVLADTADSCRWQQLAQLEKAFLAELSSANLSDPLERMALAMDHLDAFRDFDRIILFGLPDLLPAVRRRLCAIDEAGICPIEIVVTAPPEFHALFDEWGTVKPESWANRPLDFGPPAGRIHAVQDPPEMARLARLLAPGSDGVFDAAKTVITITDPKFFPVIAREFSSLRRESDGTPVELYDPSGVSMQRLRIVPLLDAFLSLLDKCSPETLKKLFYSQDFLRFICIKCGCSQDQLTGELDEYLMDRLPDVLTEHFPPAPQHLTLAFRAIFDLRGLLSSSGEPLRTLREVFRQIFPDDTPPPYLGVSLDAEAEIFRSVMADFEKSELLKNLSMRDCLFMLTDRLSSEKRYADHAPDALELTGFLDLPFRGAERVILCGMNEGLLPEMQPSDLFLTDTRRTLLGLPNNASRYARDSFYLDSLLCLFRNQPDALHFISFRTDETGAPARFSTLYFHGSDEDILERAKVLFSPEKVPEKFQQETDDAFTLAPDLTQAFHPEDTPDDTIRLSVTNFKELLASPIRACLGRSLGMACPDYKMQELDAPSLGTACHAALQNFHAENCKSADDAAEQLIALFRHALNLKCGVPLPLLPRIQLELFSQRLRKAAGILFESQKQFIPIAREWHLNRGKGIMFHGAEIRGTIDRIELSSDGRILRLIDFKTADSGSKPSATYSPTNGFSDLQLPLYRILLPKDEAFREEFPKIDLDKVNIQCGYFLLPKAVSFTGYAPWDTLTTDMIKEAEKLAEDMIDVVRMMRKGILVENPDAVVRYDSFQKFFLPDVRTVLPGIQWTAELEKGENDNAK